MPNDAATGAIRVAPVANANGRLQWSAELRHKRVLHPDSTRNALASRRAASNRFPRSFATDVEIESD